MLQCGGCSVAPVIPILTNPVVWLMALAAITTVVTGRGKKK